MTLEKEVEFIKASSGCSQRELGKSLGFFFKAGRLQKSVMCFMCSQIDINAQGKKTEGHLKKLRLFLWLDDGRNIEVLRGI